MSEDGSMSDYEIVTTDYKIIVDGTDETFHRAFTGEPQINLTFEHEGQVYRVASRAHDEHVSEPTFHVTKA